VYKIQSVLSGIIKYARIDDAAYTSTLVLTSLIIIASGISAEVNPSKNKVLKVKKFAAYNIIRVKAISIPPFVILEALVFFIKTSF